MTKLLFVRSLSYLLISLFIILFSASVLFADGKVLKFAVTDVQGLEELQREFAAFEAAISKFSGVQIKLFPISSRTAVVEALRSKNLDLALVGPAEYVVIKEKTGAVPVVAFSRPDYFSALITLRKSGIYEAKELRGKKVALGDFGSTSYHLAPLKLILDSGLSVNDIQILYVNKNIAWLALKNEDVAAIGMN